MSSSIAQRMNEILKEHQRNRDKQSQLRRCVLKLWPFMHSSFQFGLPNGCSSLNDLLMVFC
jgi:hypothetical protein